MISLLRFKGRRVATLVLRDAACLMPIVSYSLSMVGLGCVAGAPRFALAGCCLAPDGLNSRTLTFACPPNRGETSITLWCVGFRHRQPITTYGHILHLVIARGGGCDVVLWKRRREGAPSHTHRSEPNTPARLERNHKGQAEPCHTVSQDVNALLFQYAPNLLDIIHINAGDTDMALDLTITVLNNFDLKRDTVQTKNDFPAQ